jgi:type I restriction enzyme S subunit
MRSAVFKRVQFSTEIIATQINPEDLGDTEVALYSIPAIQETGKPMIQSASGISSNKWLLNGGEILVSKLNVHKNCVAIVETHGDLPLLCSTEFVPFLPKDIDSRFLKYVFQSNETIQHLMSFSESATRSHSRVNPSDIIKLKVNQPDVVLQGSIADFLDCETTRIDRLISEKESMLALLEEKLSAIISRVVTRGLDANASLKPSEQEWLGEIPAHWHEPRAKGLFREVDRRTETGEETLLSLRMGKGLVPHKEVSEKDLEASDVIGFKKVEPGQMVINRMRAASGLIAVATEPGLVSPDYAVFEVVDHGLSIEYFLELFKTSLLQAVFRSSSKGLGTGEQGFLRLYTDAFLSLHFPYPAIDEQKAIVAFIQQERAEMFHMESLLLRSIELAKERRSALISAAVTCQLSIEEIAR